MAKSSIRSVFSIPTPELVGAFEDWQHNQEKKVLGFAYEIVYWELERRGALPA